MKKVEIYSIGFFYLSVCADKTLSIKEITDEVNSENSTEAWKFSDDPKFAQGKTNPCECEKDPNRNHYLFDI